MGIEMSYDQIYKALMAEGIEEYVPDGVSLSHPVADFRNGRIIDCFLLFSTSRDGSKYTVPTARILIDSEKKELIDFRTVEEMPFSVYNGTDYYTNDTNNQDSERLKEIELEYQELYMKVRKIAFKDNPSVSDRELIVQYIRSLKAVEYKDMQPYLFELGKTFFEWAKSVIKK